MILEGVSGRNGFPLITITLPKQEKRSNKDPIEWKYFGIFLPYLKKQGGITEYRCQ